MEPLAEVATFSDHVYLTRANHDFSRIAIQGRTSPRQDDRTVVVVEGTTGRELWRALANYDAPAGGLALDPAGATLAYRHAEPFEMRVVDLATGDLLGETKHLAMALGPRGDLWCRYDSELPFGCTLFAGIPPKQSVGLGGIGRDSVLGAEFSFDGALLAWGHPDGGVHVCELETLRRRLHDLGLSDGPLSRAR